MGDLTNFFLFFFADYKRHFLVFGSLLSLLLLSIVIWMIVLLIKYETPNFTNFVVAPPATTPAEFEGAEGFADFRSKYY